MTHWDLEHRIFAVEQYFRNNESIGMVQQLFRKHFNIARNNVIPDENTILRWVDAFRLTGSVIKRRPSDYPQPVPQIATYINMDVENDIQETLPSVSKRHMSALNLARRSLQKLLRSDLSSTTRNF